jgi:hypothetical protein
MKVINLEKDSDGVYKPVKMPYKEQKIYNRGNIHELIADNGEKLSNILEKVNSFTQVAIKISKIISNK